MLAIGSRVSIEGEAQTNCQSPAKSFRPSSISFASGSSVMRRFFHSSSWPGLSRPSTTCFLWPKDVDARDKPGHDELESSSYDHAWSSALLIGLLGEGRLEIVEQLHLHAVLA